MSFVSPYKNGFVNPTKSGVFPRNSGFVGIL